MKEDNYCLSMAKGRKINGVFMRLSMVSRR